MDRISVRISGVDPFQHEDTERALFVSQYWIEGCMHSFAEESTWHRWSIRKDRGDGAVRDNQSTIRQMYSGVRRFIHSHRRKLLEATYYI